MEEFLPIKDLDNLYPYGCLDCSNSIQFSLPEGNNIIVSRAVHGSLSIHVFLINGSKGSFTEKVMPPPGLG